MAEGNSPDSPPATLGSVSLADTRFGSYLFVHAAWFLTNGLQGVLLPYLVTVVLRGSAAELGIAQMCLTLPSTFLVLIGGLIADRVDVKRQISRLYIFTTIPYLLLGVFIAVHVFSYPLMIAYALSVGSISAFTLPTRDALLARMAPSPEGGGIQRAVSLASLAQFSGQIVAMTVATGARIFGIIPLFFLQVIVMGSGAALAQRLRPRPAPPKRDRGKGNVFAFAWSEFEAGLKAVFASPVIGPLTIMSFGVGASLPGSMQVLMPLLVKSYFPANLAIADQPRIESALAIFTLCFWLGTITTATSLVRLGMPRYKGRLYIFGIVGGGTLLFVEMLHLPFALFCGLNFFWGVANGVIITLGRGIVQELAQEHLRARILSVFSFGFMVGGPVGAVALGFLAGALGPHEALLFPGTLAIVIALAAVVLTPLWRLSIEPLVHEVPTPRTEPV